MNEKNITYIFNGTVNSITVMDSVMEYKYGRTKHIKNVGFMGRFFMGYLRTIVSERELWYCRYDSFGHSESYVDRLIDIGGHYMDNESNIIRKACVKIKYIVGFDEMVRTVYFDTFEDAIDWSRHVVNSNKALKNRETRVIVDETITPNETE